MCLRLWEDIHQFISMHSGIYDDPTAPDSTAHFDCPPLSLPLAFHLDPILLKSFTTGTELTVFSISNSPYISVASQCHNMSRSHTHIYYVHAAFDVHQLDFLPIRCFWQNTNPLSFASLPTPDVKVVVFRHCSTKPTAYRNLANWNTT